MYRAAEHFSLKAIQWGKMLVNCFDIQHYEATCQDHLIPFFILRMCLVWHEETWRRKPDCSVSWLVTEGNLSHGSSPLWPWMPPRTLNIYRASDIIAIRETLCGQNSQKSAPARRIVKWCPLLHWCFDKKCTLFPSLKWAWQIPFREWVWEEWIRGKFWPVAYSKKRIQCSLHHVDQIPSKPPESSELISHYSVIFLRKSLEGKQVLFLPPPF